MSDAPTPAPTPVPRGPRVRKREVFDRPAVPPHLEPFPLRWHKHRGYFYVEREGRAHTYGRDPVAAKAAWEKDTQAWERHEAGPSELRQGYTLADAVNLFMTRQKRRWERGRLSDGQFAMYRRELAGDPKADPPVVGFLGAAVSLSTRLSHFTDERRAPDLFQRVTAAALSRGLEAARKHMNAFAATLRYAHKKRLMGPPNFSDYFEPPTPGEIEAAREDKDAKRGGRAWSIAELRRILADAKSRVNPPKGQGYRRNPRVYAWVLLGLLCFYGPADMAALRERHWDRVNKVLTQPRVKSRRGHRRRKRVNPVPDELAWALDEVIKSRPAALDPDDADRVFLSDEGKAYRPGKTRYDAAGVPIGRGRTDVISLTILRMLKTLELNRRGARAYTFRAMGRSLLVGSGADRDIVAVLMGRPFQHRSDEYYLRGDLRKKLFAAVEHVWRQLQPVKRTAPRKKGRRGGGGGAARARK